MARAKREPAISQPEKPKVEKPPEPQRFYAQAVEIDLNVCTITATDAKGAALVVLFSRDVAQGIAFLHRR